MKVTDGRAPTRNDVARRAGVSGAVVSYVVNGGPRGVAEPTAARVRAAIAELGYHPNRAAEAFRRGSTGMVGLIVSDNENPFFAEFAREIEGAAGARGLRLAIGNSHGDVELEETLVTDLLERRVDGLIVASLLRRPDNRHGVLARLTPRPPVVWVDATGPVPGFVSIGSDARTGAEVAVDHLLRTHRYRRIAMISGRRTDRFVDARELGWRAALRRAGCPAGPLVRGAWSRDGGYAAGGELLDVPRRQRPAAVFTASDLQAVGLLRAARERGLDIPGDLAVISYDGSKESEYTWPALTIVRQDISAMATAAVDAIVDSGPAHHQWFTPTLIYRDSCGCGGEQHV